MVWPRAAGLGGKGGWAMRSTRLIPVLSILAMLGGLALRATPAQATFPGTNGRIAFSTDNGDDPQIFTVNPDGSGETQLTFDDSGHSSAPEWSPDGTKIAFDSNKGGLISAVWVMKADGSNQHRLTAPELEAFYPDWSPDGAHILFTDHCCPPHSNIWVMNGDGSGLKQLTHFPLKHSGQFGTYSPDGKKIVLASDRKYRIGQCCPNDLFTMNANGTGLTRITTDQPATLLSDWGTAP